MLGGARFRPFRIKQAQTRGAATHRIQIRMIASCVQFVGQDRTLQIEGIKLLGVGCLHRPQAALYAHLRALKDAITRDH